MPVNAGNPFNQSGTSNLESGMQPYESLELPSSPTHLLPHQMPPEQYAMTQAAENIAGSLQGPKIGRSASQPVSEHKPVPISENPAVQAAARIIAKTLNIEDIKAFANMPSKSAQENPQIQETPAAATNQWGLPTPLSTNPFAQRAFVPVNEARVNPFGGPPATGSIQHPENSGNFGNPFVQPTETTNQQVSPQNFNQSSPIEEWADAMAAKAEARLNQLENVQQTAAQPNPFAESTAANNFAGAIATTAQPMLHENENVQSSPARENPFTAPSVSDKNNSSTPLRSPESSRLSSHRNEDGSLRPSPEAQEVFRMFEEERKIQIESPFAFNQPAARASASPNFAEPGVSQFATNIATSLQPEDATSNTPHQQVGQMTPAEEALMGQTLTSTDTAVWTRTPIQGFAENVARSFEEELYQPEITVSADVSAPNNMNSNQQSFNSTPQPEFQNLAANIASTGFTQPEDPIQNMSDIKLDTENQVPEEAKVEQAFGQPPADFVQWLQNMENSTTSASPSTEANEENEEQKNQSSEQVAPAVHGFAGNIA